MGMLTNGQQGDNVLIMSTGSAKTSSQLKGYILSAIDMEEDLASSVYLDYTSSRNWPADANKEVLREIQSYLKILLDDTAKHKTKFVQMKKMLGQK